MCACVCVCASRLVSEQGEELKVDELSKGLKVLAKQVKGTAYRDVMKLLRLLLSGLQVSQQTNSLKRLPHVCSTPSSYVRMSDIDFVTDIPTFSSSLFPIATSSNTDTGHRGMNTLWLICVIVSSCMMLSVTTALFFFHTYNVPSAPCQQCSDWLLLLGSQLFPLFFLSFF